MDTIQRSPQKGIRCSEEMEQRAQALVDAHSHFVGRARRFEFQFCEDVLVVRGCVPSFYLKQILQCALKGLEGVRLIDNQVSVISSDGLSLFDRGFE